MFWRSDGRTAPAVIVTLDFPTSDVAEFIGRLGCDAVAVDLELNLASSTDLSDLVRACEVAGVELVARVPLRRDVVERAIGAGVRTLQLTHVEDASDVDSVVDWCSFPPEGSRGIGRARVNSFGHHPGGYPDLVEANRRDGLALLVHIETVEATKHIAEIAARAWVKCLVVGAHDLAASAGRPGDPGHPEIVELVDRAVAAVNDTDTELALSASAPVDARSAIARGADVLVVSQARLMSGSLTALTSVVAMEAS